MYWKHDDDDDQLASFRPSVILVSYTLSVQVKALFLGGAKCHAVLVASLNNVPQCKWASGAPYRIYTIWIYCIWQLEWREPYYHLPFSARIPSTQQSLRARYLKSWLSHHSQINSRPSLQNCSGPTALKSALPWALLSTLTCRLANLCRWVKHMCKCTVLPLDRNERLQCVMWRLRTRVQLSSYAVSSRLCLVRSSKFRWHFAILLHCHNPKQ